MREQPVRHFTAKEHGTWDHLFGQLEGNRQTKAYPLFARGVELLELGGSGVPDMTRVNRQMEQATGWRGVPVEGHIPGPVFFPALKGRRFPVGNFIRELGVATYTPAPDIFHDLYGHLPYFVDREYTQFLDRFAELAARYCSRAEACTLLERYFWFTFEFGLIETEHGRRIFGSGLLSSQAESEYALSAGPQVLPFSVEAICQQDFSIDVYQEHLFLLQNWEQLTGSLEALERTLRRVG